MILDRYPAARTHTVRQAQDWIGVAHPDGWIRTQSPDSFQFFTNITRTPRLRLAWSSCSPECDTMLPPAPYVRHSFPISNPSRYEMGKRLPWISEASTGCLLPPDEELLVRHTKAFEQFTICIPQNVLDAMFVSLNGNASKPISFAFGVPQSRNQTRFLRQSVMAFAEEINAFGPGLSAVALAEMEQSVIARFVLFNTHDHSDALLTRPPSTSRDRVERAEDFIRENWDRPLDFEALSRVTNTSIRSLFRAFRDFRSYSPADFARTARLERARSMILQHDDASIIGIALQCGFQNVGRFASIYRKAYGELPSETRKRKTSFGY